jgi:Fe-Mn family superoxide dismutase
VPQTVTPLPFKPSRLQGLSERLLASHYENNYGGALRRLNAIERRLGELDWAAAPVFEINGLKREELIAAGSVILHEVYFDGLALQLLFSLQVCALCAGLVSAAPG